MNFEWERFNERNKFGRLLSTNKCEFIELVLTDLGLAIKQHTFNSYELTISEIENIISQNKLAKTFDSFFNYYNENWLLPIYSVLFDLNSSKETISFASIDFYETIQNFENQTGHKVDLMLMI